jgi:hypothetical protein
LEWSGEASDIIRLLKARLTTQEVFDGLNVNRGENDTRAIFEQLESGESFEDVLSRIEGP